MIDSVASLLKFALSSKAYAHDKLTQTHLITRTLQLAYRLLLFVVKVRLVPPILPLFIRECGGSFCKASRVWCWLAIRVTVKMSCTPGHGST